MPWLHFLFLDPLDSFMGYSYVGIQIRFASVSSVAQFALKWFFSSMSVHML